MYYSISKRDLEYKYFFVGYKDLNKYYNKKKFLEKAKVREESYAGRLISRIYNGILINTIDLKREYERYYAKEYNTFKEFLYQKYFIEYSEMECWEDILNKENTIYYGDLLKNDDYEIATLLENRDLIERINKIFKECSNEVKRGFCNQ